MDEITREEAAQILQVSIDADAETVNNAYKKATRRFHPDAWRNKSPELQKHAEEIYTKLVPAKNKMLEPYADYLQQKHHVENRRSTPTAQRAQQQAYGQSPTSNKQYQDMSQPTSGGYANNYGYQYQPQPYRYQPQRQPAQSTPYSRDGSTSWNTGNVSSEYVGAEPGPGKANKGIRQASRAASETSPMQWKMHCKICTTPSSKTSTSSRKTA